MNQKKYLDILLIFTIGYVATVFMLIIFNYVLYSYYGFSNQTFSFVSLIILFSAVLIGYFLAQTVFEPFFKQYQNIEKFTRNTLHEVNIPVATIKANTQMLLSSESDEKKVKKLSRIIESCDNLINLYQELDYGVTNEIEVNSLSNVNIVTLIEKLIKDFQLLHEDFEFSFEYDRVEEYKLDEFGFIKVLRNIMDNSIKYSSENKKIFIRLQESNLSIQDFGIGMDSIQILQIFERYYQVDESRDGKGIGLNLVKEYCDKNRIEININSIQGKGTTIFLNLKNSSL